MPIETSIWRIDGSLQRVEFATLSSESKLEEVLSKDIAVLDPSLMVLGRQVPTAFGTFVDILAIDAQGSLSVIELKRGQTPREVVAQALDYASWVQGLSYDEIVKVFSADNPGR